MAEKTNKLNIYLIKETVADLANAVKPGSVAYPIDGVGTFFGQNSRSNTPDWAKTFFGGLLDSHFRIFSASSRGILLVSVRHQANDRILAVTFGQGRHLLKEDVIEEGFGLRTVLNSVVRDSLRSIDKTTLGSIPKQSREQLGRESDAGNFGIDIEQDLVNSVTGRSIDARIGKTISGRDSVSVSVKIDINTIREFLVIIIEKFLSEKYKEDFGWIDQIKSIKDTATIDSLNSWLIGSLENRTLDRIWMAPPTVLDWVNVKGFRYGGKVRPTLHSDLDTNDFLNESKTASFTIQTLKGRSVHAISAKNDDVLESWSAYKCIYAEHRAGSHVYILNNGQWYKISDDFSREIIAEFSAMPESTISLPDYTLVHNNENEYNKDVPNSVAGSCCMDCEFIYYGGGRNKIEFCDLYTDKKQIIHVKRYGGAAQFSHLFNQGVVSGELFVQAPKFRELLNAKLPATYKLSDTVARPNASEYEIVFAIISKSANPLDIPFFAKVGMRNAARRLGGYGYTVTKKKIRAL